MSKGFEGGKVAPLYEIWGSATRKIFLDPILGGANLPMDLCIVFTHGFRRDGFWSIVLDASACINMYWNIERNITKNQSGSLCFGIHGKIFVYMCFMCYALALFLYMFWNSYASNFCTGLKPTP